MPIISFQPYRNIHASRAVYRKPGAFAATTTTNNANGDPFSPVKFKFNNEARNKNLKVPIFNPIRSYDNPETIGKVIMHANIATGIHDVIGKSKFDWTIQGQPLRHVSQDPVMTLDKPYHVPATTAASRAYAAATNTNAGQECQPIAGEIGDVDCSSLSTDPSNPKTKCPAGTHCCSPGPPGQIGCSGQPAGKPSSSSSHQHKSTRPSKSINTLPVGLPPVSAETKKHHGASKTLTGATALPQVPPAPTTKDKITKDKGKDSGSKGKGKGKDSTTTPADSTSTTPTPDTSTPTPTPTPPPPSGFSISGITSWVKEHKTEAVVIAVAIVFLMMLVTNKSSPSGKMKKG